MLRFKSMSDAALDAEIAKLRHKAGDAPLSVEGHYNDAYARFSREWGEAVEERERRAGRKAEPEMLHMTMFTGTVDMRDLKIQARDAGLLDGLPLPPNYFDR